MERFRVLLYPAAKRDFMELIWELDLLPPAAALRAYDLLCEQIKSLGHMPERCPRPRDLALRARGYRCLSVDRYLVLYTISGSDVLLRRILRRRPEHSGLLI
ncbi:MAG TPA: type II toxin-antitoxin system RelE/ParE family toxin [Candidatus Scatomorpha pullistercoris]|uniref:Type II toxin-antitoxin system RelE/ParE family toxin n=1 Tax=Candidatus Scatomorpha pullistercoris TaxID=2840929 RepID=A0A9D1G5Z1_9FIRM|nr:type II toxin-antitoxin system RelE/ParE family toxin [Candidatus Scatomorpha pullistercoris]